MVESNNTENTGSVAQSIGPNSKGTFGRIIAIFAVIVVFIALLAVSTTRQSTADKVWNREMTVGNLEAKNLYIMYTDLICPYCDVFSRQVLEHWDEFLAYLDENDILFEIRLTDALYEGAGSSYSRDAAEAAYCAKREDKFWEYYHGAIEALWKDYQSKGIGSSKSAPPITDLPKDYWTKIGHAAGLGTDFDQCVAERATADEVQESTRRAMQTAEGMPSFKFNKFSTSGFGEDWDWTYVKRYLDAGLE